MTVVATTTPLRVGQSMDWYFIIIDDRTGEEVDVSQASSLKMKFRKPSDGSEIEKTATASGGSTGETHYEDTDGETTSEAGAWRGWGVAVISGKTYYSEVCKYTVKAEGEL